MRLLNKHIPGAALLISLLLTACNLSNDQPAGLLTPPATTLETTLVPVTEEAPNEVEPLLPTPTQLPVIGLTPINSNRQPTRTPVGGSSNTAPTLNAVVTALPTSPTGEHAVISSPAQGASVTPGTIQFSGMVYNLPEDRFTLSLVEPDGSPINSQNITLRNPNAVAEVPWSAAMQVTRYTGPAQVRVIARTADNSERTLAAVDIVIGEGGASGNTAPTTAAVRAANGATGSIDTPRSGETVSGDPIMITGTAGGFSGGTFTLELIASDGTALSSIPITLSGSDTAVVPWAAPVSTGGYRGSVTIRAVVSADGNQVVLASANLVLQ